MRSTSLRLRFAAALLLLALDAARGGAPHGSLRATTRSHDAHHRRSPPRQRLGAGGHSVLAEEKRPLMVLRGGFVAEDTTTEPSPPGDAVTDGDEDMADGGSNAETEGETDLRWKRRGLSLRRRGKAKGEEGDGQEGKGEKPAKRPRGRPRLPPGKDRKRPKCENADCVMAPSFGIKGSKPRFCSKHAQEGMVNLLKIRARTCEEPECFRYPNFAVDMKHRPRFCSLHHPAGYVNVYGDRRCSWSEGCSKQPSYGFQGSGPLFCSDHKQEEHVLVRRIPCKAPEGCKFQASFGIPGEMPKFCTRHKGANHSNLLSPKCAIGGCKSFPLYGNGTDSAFRFCMMHRRPGDHNLKSKKCEQGGCLKQPCFGVKGGRPRFCLDHVQGKGMINLMRLKARKCETEHCKRRPSFSASETEPARFCAKHHPPGYTNIYSKRCRHEGCSRQASYGIREQRITIACGQHRSEYGGGKLVHMWGMCKHPGCGVNATFGDPSDCVRVFCRKHMDPERHINCKTRRKLEGSVLLLGDSTVQVQRRVGRVDA